MGKKKKAVEKVEEKIELFCYYCDRKFDDEKVLIQHQKQKHFKCEMCNKKLSTAGGLLVHVQQVHKQNIRRIPNAMPGRDSTEVEVYGMEGVPDELLTEQHKRMRYGPAAPAPLAMSGPGGRGAPLPHYP